MCPTKVLPKLRRQRFAAEIAVRKLPGPFGQEKSVKLSRFCCSSLIAVKRSQIVAIWAVVKQIYWLYHKCVNCRRSGHCRRPDTQFFQPMQSRDHRFWPIIINQPPAVEMGWFWQSRHLHCPYTEGFCRTYVVDCGRWHLNLATKDRRSASSNRKDNIVNSTQAHLSRTFKRRILLRLKPDISAVYYPSFEKPNSVCEWISNLSADET